MLSIPKYPEQYAQHFPAIFYLLCCASQHHVICFGPSSFLHAMMVKGTDSGASKPCTAHCPLLYIHLSIGAYYCCEFDSIV